MLMFSCSYVICCSKLQIYLRFIYFFFFSARLGIATDNVKLFSYNSLRSATQLFNPTNRIGRGGFGVVYKVTS